MPWTPPAQAAPKPSESSPLAWYVLAASLLVVGLLALVANLPDLHVTLGQYLGAVLLVFGVGLLVAVWWGRAPIVILLGILLLPVAIGASLINVPMSGGVADLSFRPQVATELRPEYRLAVGGLRLDLTDLAPTDQPITITASVGAGRIAVTLPERARVQVDASVNVGRLLLFGSPQTGTWLSDHIERPGTGGPLIILRLEAGVGSVSIDSVPTE